PGGSRGSPPRPSRSAPRRPGTPDRASHRTASLAPDNAAKEGSHSVADRRHRAPDGVAETASPAEHARVIRGQLPTQGPAMAPGEGVSTLGLQPITEQRLGDVPCPEAPLCRADPEVPVLVASG